ncbi:hypothetical protein PM082_018410 [Marasmius tenuissimus]|nr:hypothetical protein PM082_018410 [Marasmius tenuissimus]
MTHTLCSRGTLHFSSLLKQSREPLFTLSRATSTELDLKSRETMEPKQENEHTPTDSESAAVATTDDVPTSLEEPQVVLGAILLDILADSNRDSVEKGLQEAIPGLKEELVKKCQELIREVRQHEELLRFSLRQLEELAELAAHLLAHLL